MESELPPPSEEPLAERLKLAFGAKSITDVHLHDVMDFVVAERIATHEDANAVAKHFSEENVPQLVRALAEMLAKRKTDTPPSAAPDTIVSETILSAGELLELAKAVSDQVERAEPETI